MRVRVPTGDLMVTARVSFTSSRPSERAIRAVFRDADGPVGRDIDARSRRVLARAQRDVGVRSGRLLASGRREFGEQPTGIYHDVVFGLPGVTNYLGYHMFGTEPHIIRPRRRKALRFVSGGTVVFATRVSHPGTRGNDFLRNALREAR